MKMNAPLNSVPCTSVYFWTKLKFDAWDVTEETKPCTTVPRKPMTRDKLDLMRVLEEKSRLKFGAKALVQDNEYDKGSGIPI
jgi:hypothetical protein